MTTAVNTNEVPPSVVARPLPTLLVVTGLVVIAWWGHATEWRFTRSDHRSRIDSIHNRPLAVVTTGQAGSVMLTFASAEAVDAAGIDVAPVWKTSMTETIPAPGEILFDPNRVTRLSARASGSCVRVGKTVGDLVKPGDLLAVIDAADVGKAKTEFLQALVQVKLKKQSLSNLDVAGAVVPARQRAEAEAALREADAKWLAAEQSLVNIGLSVRIADYASLTPEEANTQLRTVGIDGPAMSANLLPLRSPAAGVVMSANIVEGEVVAAGQVLFVVVDPSRLWLNMNVTADDARRVVVGQPVNFRPDGSAQSVDGRINWLGPAVDESTRTLPVRAELDNRTGQLRASTLGRGRITVREVANAMTVPDAAVQLFRGQSVVFVRDPAFLKADGSKSFHLRRVRVGTSDGQITEILDGLQPDDIVAAKNVAGLVSEIQRSQSLNKGDHP